MENGKNVKDKYKL